MRRGGDGLRRAVRRLHLRLGLTLGALFVLLGLTGSVLVFYPELDAALHPEIRVEGGRAPDWDRALATLRAEWPEKGGPWRLENTGRSGAILIPALNSTWRDEWTGSVWPWWARI